jgi:hypothetical protein
MGTVLMPLLPALLEEIETTHAEILLTRPKPEPASADSVLIGMVEPTREMCKPDTLTHYPQHSQTP